VRPTPADLAAALRRGGPWRQDVAALARAGYVTGAVTTFRRGSAAFAMSLAAQTASAAQARSLMGYLTAVGDEYTTPHRIERRPLASIPGSVVVTVPFTPAGDPPSDLVRIAFTDGPFAYLEVAASAPRAAAAALARDAVALWRRVAGRPPP